MAECTLSIFYTARAQAVTIAGKQRISKDRFSRHNSGRSKASKSGRPWEIVKVIEVESRAEARHLEKKIKGRGIQRFLESL